MVNLSQSLVIESNVQFRDFPLNNNSTDIMHV